MGRENRWVSGWLFDSFEKKKVENHAGIVIKTTYLDKNLRVPRLWALENRPNTRRAPGAIISVLPLPRMLLPYTNNQPPDTRKYSTRG
jgi:hypothetical protein